MRGLRHQLINGRANCRGMTLLELLLALAGTAVVGTAVAMMLAGVAYGTQTDKDLRTLITRQMALRGRVEAQVRQSQMVLDSGAGYMILWQNDTDDSGTPNKSEIQVIEHDVGMDRLMFYGPADGITDVEYALTDDFRTLTDVYKGDATFPSERWADNLSSLTISLDDADPQLAKLVSFRFELLNGDVPDTAIGAATLRNEAGE